MKLLVSFSAMANNKSEENSSQHPCFPPWKGLTEKWASASIFNAALCVFMHCPVSEGSWLWLWNAADLHLLPTGDCKASVNTKILSFLFPLYLLTCLHSVFALIYIQWNTHTHTHTHTHIPHRPCQRAPVTPRASLYMEHMLGNVTAPAANGSGTLQ